MKPKWTKWKQTAHGKCTLKGLRKISCEITVKSLFLSENDKKKHFISLPWSRNLFYTAVQVLYYVSRAVTKRVIGGGGGVEYSYIRFSLTDLFCKTIALQKEIRRTEPNIWIFKLFPKRKLEWNKIMSNKDNARHELLLNKLNRPLRQRGHEFELPIVRTERFKCSFLNRCLFKFVWYLILF